MANREIEISTYEIIDYMLNNKASIRAVASHFNCSKTFIWNRLREYNGKDKEKIDTLLKNNKIKSQKQLNEKRN